MKDNKRIVDAFQREVDVLRKAYGNNIISDVHISGRYAEYTFNPDSIYGYIQQYDLLTGEERHCGLGSGCFWTDWEPDTTLSEYV